MTERKGLERRLFWLYEGFGTGPYIFRWILLALDAAAVAFFLWAPLQPDKNAWFYIIEYVIAAFILFDFLARFWIARPRFKFFLNPLNLADIVVLASLILPMIFSNLAFLRILRAIRLVRAFTFLRQVQGFSSFLKQYSEIIDRIVNLIVFILIMASLVYSTQLGRNEAIGTYIDAVYFTVATLTTTGFGDVVLIGWDGKLLSVLIMVLGISLFLRLVQSIIRPAKIKHECSRCHLMRHEPDAIHCKHCGESLGLARDGGE